MSGNLPVQIHHLHRQIIRHLIWPEVATQNEKSAGQPWEYLNSLIRVVRLFQLRLRLGWQFISTVLIHPRRSESYEPAME